MNSRRDFHSHRTALFDGIEGGIRGSVSSSREIHEHENDQAVDSLHDRVSILKRLVFSSSATVYGWPKEVPCTEEFPLSAMNPYGRTKLVIEDICRDLQRLDPNWKIILLRYFNPVGAHPSGYIGEDPLRIPNNLMPYIQQVAVGRRPALTVYGTDYNTKDGTGVCNYTHVDLVDGHNAALRKLYEDFDRIENPVVYAARRPGDAVVVYAATTKAEKELKWKAKFGVDEMSRNLWNWASKNPYRYGSSENGQRQLHP